ncbi:MAG: glycosyltransferase [Candidatus Gastranaerophilales bacterium]
MGTSLSQMYNTEASLKSHNFKEEFLHPKFSIIIPVYNVQGYIEECLFSIINQTFKEFEIICINDGSTDDSLGILKIFAQHDNRIKIIDQENQGQGVARNNGIDIAKGEYISFVDPDDWIELDMYEQIYKKLKETSAEVLQFNFESYDEISKKSKLDSLYKNRKNKFKHDLRKMPCYSWRDYKGNYMLELTLAVWNKVYSTKFIKENDIYFAPNKHGEDHIFSLNSMMSTDKIQYFEKSFYHYRTRIGSAVNKVSDDNFCVFENVELLEILLNKKNLINETKKEFGEYKTNVLAWHYCCVLEDSREKYLSKCREVLTKEEYKSFYKIKDGKFSFIENIFALKNKKMNGRKVKVLKLLGFEFVIKKRSTS